MRETSFNCVLVMVKQTSNKVLLEARTIENILTHGLHIVMACVSAVDQVNMYPAEESISVTAVTIINGGLVSAEDYPHFNTRKSVLSF